MCYSAREYVSTRYDERIIANYALHAFRASLPRVAEGRGGRAQGEALLHERREVLVRRAGHGAAGPAACFLSRARIS